jgi:ribosomal protein S12 methylthiotransferase accessory factor YcaO
MEREENLEAVVQALSQVFERDLFIECQVDATVRDAIPPEVENDGLVATTLRDLGGEIVDI